MLKDSELRTPFNALVKGCSLPSAANHNRRFARELENPAVKAIYLQELASWCRKRVNLYFLFVEDFLRSHTNYSVKTGLWSYVVQVACVFRSPWYFRVDGPGREASESCMEDHFVLRLDDLIESMDCRDIRYLSHPSSSGANFRIVLPKLGNWGSQLLECFRKTLCSTGEDHIFRLHI